MKRILVLLAALPLLATSQWQVPDRSRLESRIESFYQAMFSVDLETLYELYWPVIRSTTDFESWKKQMVDEESMVDIPDSAIQQFAIKSYDWCGDYDTQYRCVVVVHLVVETGGKVEEGDLKALWIRDDGEWYYGLELHH